MNRNDTNKQDILLGENSSDWLIPKAPDPPMETPDPPNDTPGALKQVVLTPHDIPWSLRDS